MDKKRREFLKVAGISTIAGLGAPAVVSKLISGTSPAMARGSEEAGHGNHGSEAAGHEGESAHEVQATGVRYGMVIDTKKFNRDPELAKKCIHACHSEHNVPDFGEDTQHEIKWIWLASFENVFPEHSNYHPSEEIENHQILTLCNHCDNPPCVRACPTKATFKAANGMIEMDYHRCIGCRFCMAACPYGARSFNWLDPRKALDMTKVNHNFPTRMRGVVEKCTLCPERVEIGKLPACAEVAESSKAIIFGDLNDPNSEIRKVLRENFTIQRKPSLGTHPSVFYIV